ncbi:dopamine receptor 1-like [Tigriopus californicus]|uniref:dopamine receptor 1-like n=1 Tax=Tigriopus californicus TaxID=6832 RepID=UPI0027DA930C|nr:dopamine receptor 1-like [Tigriopus californicus]
MFTLIVVAIIGNGLILFAISSRKTLQKLPNLFIASLAFADMFVAIFVMPFALVNDFGNWPFEKTVCILWISTDVLCSTASITNLCAISLERYIHVKNPLQYFKWITKSNVLISIAGIWISSCLVSCVPVFMDIHSGNNFKHFHLKNGTCSPSFSFEYSVLSSLFSFFAPCCIMLLIYYHVYQLAQHHMESIRHLNEPLLRLRKIHLNQKTCHSSEQVPSVFRKSGRRVIKRSRFLKTISNSPHVQEHKAAITIGILMGVFMLCWTPFFIVNILAGMCTKCVSETTFQAFSWLGYSNSAFNPIIYSIFNSEFRRAFASILFRK